MGGAAPSATSSSAATGVRRWPRSPALKDVSPWRLAVVLESGDTTARLGLQPGRDKTGEVTAERETGQLTLEGARLDGQAIAARLPVTGRHRLRRAAGRQAGPVSFAAGPRHLRRARRDGSLYGTGLCHGRGFSFDQSEFNRATQALRQPARPSSPSSMPRRSTTAIRRPRWCSMPRSKSIRAGPRHLAPGERR